MDSEEFSLDTNKGASTPDTPQANSSSHIFEISDDTIAPIVEQEKRSTPPPEGELLDQKIGSFDAAPFAPPIAPTNGPILVRNPAQMPLKEVATPTIPSRKNVQSLQDEISAALPADLRKMQPVTPQPRKPEQPAQSVQPAAPTPVTQPQSNTIEHPTSPREVIKPVRTYESDVAEVMSHRRTSTASIAIAESKRDQNMERVGDEPPRHTGRKIIMLVVSILLLGGGVFGAYYLYSQSALAPVTPVVQQQKVSPSIIPATNQVVLTIPSQNSILIRKSIAAEINKQQPPDSIKEIIVATTDETGQLVRVPAIDMIKNLDISMPDVLSRSLTPRWMLGVYSNQDGVTSVFVVGTTNFFQNTFAGMLQWEHVMADDLRMFLYPENVVGVADERVGSVTSPQLDTLKGIDSILPTIGTTTVTATSTKTDVTSTTTNTSASSTIEVVSPLKQYLTIKGTFEDRIIKNKDVRAFRADNGQIVFLYSFIDNNHVVITDKESTLAELLNRLEKQAFIR